MEKKRMTKQEAIELLKNRKVYVNGKSAEIQKKLFELGFKWSTGGKEVGWEQYPFIMIANNTTFGCYCHMNLFSEDEKTEISAEEILAIKVVEELKENDVLVAGWERAGNKTEWISIVHGGDSELYDEKAGLMIEGQQEGEKTLEFGSYCDSQQWIRPATEEEKQKLIDALKESTDERAKQILKEVFGIEDEPKCPFETYDKVLVRNGKGMVWGARFFDRMMNREYACTDSLVYQQCIAYEGHEHLNGTTNNPEE